MHKSDAWHDRIHGSKSSPHRVSGERDDLLVAVRSSPRGRPQTSCGSRQAGGIQAGDQSRLRGCTSLPWGTRSTTGEIQTLFWSNNIGMASLTHLITEDALKHLTHLSWSRSTFCQDETTKIKKKKQQPTIAWYEVYFQDFPSILEEISPGCSLEAMMLKHPVLWPTHAKSWLIGKRLWCWERLGAGGEGDDRGWDGWMASLTWWMWVWVNSGSWWWTGRPGVLRFTGLQRVGHDWATELNWTERVLKS